MQPNDARARCAPALLGAGETCAVEAFGRLAAVEGQEFFYARYRVRPAPGDPLSPLPYTRIVIFAGLPSAMLQPILISEDDPSYSYDTPVIVRSGDRTLLHIPAVENGSGNFNREQLYVWSPAGWRDIDTTSWLGELEHKLPKGLSVQQGVYPDYGTMRAGTALWRAGDGPRCGNGGRAEITLRWQGDRVALSDLRVEKAGECGERRR